MNRLRGLHNKKNKGFSLVELIIVIAIMAILAGILIPQFVKYIGNSRKASDIQQAENIYNAVAALYADDAVSGKTTLQYDGELHAVTEEVSKSLDMGGTVPTSKVAGAGYTFFYCCTEDGAVSVWVGSTTGATTGNSTQLSPSITGTKAADWQ